MSAFSQHKSIFLDTCIWAKRKVKNSPFLFWGFQKKKRAFLANQKKLQSDDALLPFRRWDSKGSKNANWINPTRPVFLRFISRVRWVLTWEFIGSHRWFCGFSDGFFRYLYLLCSVLVFLGFVGGRVLVASEMILEGLYDLVDELTVRRRIPFRPVTCVAIETSTIKKRNFIMTSLLLAWYEYDGGGVEWPGD